MKRFWLVLLSLGLVLAFSASAMAVDVKFSGSFYAAGMYQDKTTFSNTAWSKYYITNATGGTTDTGHGSVGASTAFYYQRLRLQTDFIVSPGLKLVTRFDALDRIWGGVRGGDDYSSEASERQNIAFDWAYISYTSPIGLFEVGYMADNGWGTVFGNNAINGASIGAITYTVPVGPLFFNVKIGKNQDFSNSAILTNNVTDNDNDSYSACLIYAPNKDLQIGLLGAYKRVAGGRADTSVEPYPMPDYLLAYAYSVNPYAKAKFGPIAVEAEVNYAFGKATFEYDSMAYPHGSSLDIANLSAYVNAVADFGIAYVGGTFAYVSGDDPTTSTKIEGGLVDGGVDFTPCLIMFGYERNKYAGPIAGYGYLPSGYLVGSLGPAPAGGVMSNAWFGQVKGGVRPIAALDINASVSYATADKKPSFVNSSDYGWEVDVTGTYKLTNNLSYMLGGAYFFTGNYYKGWSDSNVLNNDFLLINKLTLTF